MTYFKWSFKIINRGTNKMKKLLNNIFVIDYSRILEYQ